MGLCSAGPVWVDILPEIYSSKNDGPKADISFFPEIASAA